MEYIILIIALAALVFGANILVSGSVTVAKRLHISDFVIGAIVIGIGTSLPEMVVSIIGATGGNSDVAIGNVVGSNIFNILGILGLTAAVLPVTVSRENRRFDIPVAIGLALLFILLVFNFFNGEAQSIGRVDGLILISSFLLFTSWSIIRDRKKIPSAGGHTDDDKGSLPAAILKIVFGFVFLIAGCDFFVDEAVIIAHRLGVNDAFISITLIACGTSLPELAASITAAAKKSSQMALGNIVGSNIFNLTLILGISSQITPLETKSITAIDYAVMAGALLLLAVLGSTGKITRAGGILMFLCFISYNIYLITTAM